ncbi:FG-GAP repeat protein [Haloglomus litoreum]|uniref:FG-GAP repeat protein n=1 Tax=Haloglomus litoreum TaxID=3034026 RepID=UPI0023E8A77E|nr:FG-GAP repeat protein [Haloglomus sp. DT116]
MSGDQVLVDLTRRRILVGAGAIGLASAGAGLGTSALFSDRESFDGNSLVAGTLDLLVHYDATYQGSPATNLATPSGVVDGEAGLFYTLEDVKPGDSGAVTFCFELHTNPAYLWVRTTGTEDAENGQNDPEIDAEGVDTDGLGELDDAIVASAFYCDANGDPVPGGEIATDVSLASLLALLAGGTPLNAAGSDAPAGSQAAYQPSSAPGETTGPCLCIEWELPLAVGNEVQSDSVAFDVEFGAIQARNTDGTDNPWGTSGGGSGPAPQLFPTIQQAKLFASDGDSDDGFGHAVAVDGDTALAGAWGDEDPNGSGAGSAYVFTRSGSTWSQQAKLLPTDGDAQDRFGWSVALSGDTALVGAYQDEDPNGSNSGSAYVFTRSGTTWSQQAKLLPTDGDDSDRFGYTVALDGDTAVVGAYLDEDPNGGGAGSAYVFVRSGTTWSQQAKLLPTDGETNDRFGFAVAVDGDTAVVGTSNDGDPNGPGSGSAYVFVRSGTTWTQQVKLFASDGDTYDYFGRSVAVAGDTVLVGALNDEDPNGGSAGSAYVFTRSGTTWSEEAKLAASDGDGSDQFGYAVALDGETAVVSAKTDEDPNGTFSGSAYVFTRSGSTWTEQAKLVASDGDFNDQFGHSVALSGDTAVFGAYLDGDPNGFNSGSAYVFVP